MKLLGFIAGAILWGAFGFLATIFVTSLTTGGDAFALIIFGSIYGGVAAFVGAIIGGFAGSHLGGVQPIRRKRLAAFLMVPFLCSVFFIWSSDRMGQIPSDGQLLSEFSQERSALDNLIRLIKEEKKTHTYTRSNIWNDENATQDPKLDALTKPIRSFRGLTTDDEGAEIRIDCYAQGCAACGGEEKGFVYLDHPPKHTEKNLDKLNLTEDKPVTNYRHLDKNWYLFYDYSP